MGNRTNPDLDNAQYHSVCNLMWSVLGRDTLKDNEFSVFHAVAARIRELETENKRLRSEVYKYESWAFWAKDVMVRDEARLGWFFPDCGIEFINSPKDREQIKAWLQGQKEASDG